MLKLFKSLRILVFANCFTSSLICMALFFLVSSIFCTLPFETEKYRGSNLELAVQSSEYKWWLLISIIISIPSLILRFMDFLRPWPPLCEEKLIHRNLLLSRSLEIIVIAAPNCFLYYFVSSQMDADFALIANIQNAIYYSQTVTIIGSIFSSTFGHRHRNVIPDNKLDISVEKSTVVFLFLFTSYRFFLLLSSIFSDSQGMLGCRIVSAIMLVAGFILMTLVVYKFTYYLTRQMIGLKFSEYNQMHDFLRMIGVILYASYTFIFYALTNQITSSQAVFEQQPQSLVAFLVGKILLVIYLNVVDQHCALFDANLKKEQLLIRLNLIRYISHELRSPLSSCFMGLQILRENMENVIDTVKKIRSIMTKHKIADPTGTIMTSTVKIMDEKENLLETLDLVKESSTIALETLNDMLTFDKIDEKKLVLEVEDVDIWTFVSDTVRPFRINAMKDQVSLTTECSDLESNWLQRCCIKADRFKLNQVLRNFLSNALKFSPKKTGSVKVLVERVLVSNPLTTPLGWLDSSSQIANEVVRVSVTDNGCGISLENQKSLFGQYVQFNASTLQKGGGSGLGLWISKSIPL